jgi:hypothetical protein
MYDQRTIGLASLLWLIVLSLLVIALAMHDCDVVEHTANGDPARRSGIAVLVRSL